MSSIFLKGWHQQVSCPRRWGNNTWNGDWQGQQRVHKFSALHSPVFTPLPMMAMFFWGASPLRLLSFCIPFVQHPHQFGPCWPWPAALGHCRTCVSLSWIWDKHHELGLGCVWGVELGSEDLEQLCWNTPVFTVLKITDAQVLRNPTWGHPVLPPGPRKGLNHFWEANYQKKIFWEQKNNCLNITS